MCVGEEITSVPLDRLMDWAVSVGIGMVGV